MPGHVQRRDDQVGLQAGDALDVDAQVAAELRQARDARRIVRPAVDADDASTEPEGVQDLGIRGRDGDDAARRAARAPARLVRQPSRRIALGIVARARGNVFGVSDVGRG